MAAVELYTVRPEGHVAQDSTLAAVLLRTRPIGDVVRHHHANRSVSSCSFQRNSVTIT